MADQSNMQEERQSKAQSPRRRFIASTVLSLSSLMANGIVLSGCRQDQTVQVQSEDEFESVRRVDPKLVKYRETGKIETSFQYARSVAVGPDGMVYLLGDQSLALIEPDALPKILKGQARPRMLRLDDKPMAMDVGTNGLLYVGMTDHVEVFDASGQRQAVWTALGVPSQITAVAAGAKQVWVANAAGRVVLGYDLTGHITHRLGEKNPARNYPGLILPSAHLDVAIAKDNSIFISNLGMHRIEHYTADGEYQSSWGLAGSRIDAFCGCCNPTDFALLPDGRFVTAEKGIPRVKVYSAKGQFQSVVAAPDSFSSTTMGLDLATTGDGQVLVLDPKANALLTFAPLDAAKSA